MWLFETKRVWFFDEKGEYHGKGSFSKNDKTFKYGKGSYNVDFEKSSYKEDYPIPFVWKRRTYFYNIALSNPVLLNKKAEPPISPELYNINLETKVARDLNDLASKGLMDYLTPKNIIIGLVIIVALYYLQSGGSIV